jgi:hypothetical protein
MLSEAKQEWFQVHNASNYSSILIKTPVVSSMLN